MGDSIADREAALLHLRMEYARVPGRFASIEARVVLDRVRWEHANLWIRHDAITDRRAGLEAELGWAVAEADGYRKAMALAAEREGRAGLERLAAGRKQKLSVLRAELRDFDSQLQVVRAAISEVQGRLVTAFEKAITEARHGHEAHLERERAAAALRQAQLDEWARRAAAPLWSPFAVHGYRIWRIGREGLQGIKVTWRTPHLEARCGGGGDAAGVPHTHGSCGSLTHGCGIYAAKSVGHLMESMGSIPFAVGLTGLEGKVVEHDHGYRAQRATALALAVVGSRYVSFVDDPGTVADVFSRDPSVIRLLKNGAVRTPERGSLIGLVTTYMDQQSRRFETWTSANPNV